MVLNSCVVHAPDGRRVACYDKIHLFRFRHRGPSARRGGDDEAGDTGSLPGTLWPGRSVNLLRPAPSSSIASWESPNRLLSLQHLPGRNDGARPLGSSPRARAIESPVRYVLAIGQGGRHENGRETHGNSMLIDPWGTVVDRKLKGLGVVIEHSIRP